MGGFCGWIGLDGDPGAVAPRLDAMAFALGPAGTRAAVRQVVAKEGAAMAVAVGASAIDSAQEGESIAIVVGRPSFADSELARIASERGAAAAFLRGVAEQAERILSRMSGPFAVVQIDAASRSALLSIDRIGGRHPVVWAERRGGLLFASDPSALQAHPDGRSEPDPQSLYDYLYFNVVPGPATARRDVWRLMPGECLQFRNGRAVVRPYWAARYDEDRTVGLEDLCEQFRSIVRESVRRDADLAEVGCFLSGGTDSSTVAGMLRELRGASVPTLSIGFDAQGYDEMEFARAAAERFGTEQHEYYLTPEDVVDSIPRIAAAHGDPFGNASAVPSYHCARLARELGLRRLLAGDGGDELFAGNERYATQRLYGYYQRVPGWLARGLLEPLLLNLPGRERIAPLRKMANYVARARLSVAERSQAYNHLLRLGPLTVLEPDLLEQIDLARPLALLEETFQSAIADNDLNRQLALDMRFTIADSDLPKVSRSCELAGIDVAYPLLSDELAEFAYRLPASLKLRGFELRWFMKHALRDFLPEKILRKQKHGFGMPFGEWVRTHEPLEAIARESLGRLRRRGIVRPDFIDRLLHLHESEHAKYYGVMIWVLMMLEQWYEAHVDQPVAAS